MDLDAKNREFALWLAQRLERQARRLREMAARLERQAQEESKEERSK